MTESEHRRLVETEAIRSRADEVLRHLMADRRKVERRLTESGRNDPIKAVTGRTAIDKAIADTRRLIRNMDDLLGQMNGELAGQPAAVPARGRSPRLERATVAAR